MGHPTIDAWHRIVDERNPAALADLLADDVVFHSPVVHTPQKGKPLTQMYLSAAMMVFSTSSFRYMREVVGPTDAVLEFEAELGGIHINGVDLIHWNADGRIDDFKVMVRPLKAVNMLHTMMKAMLEATK